MSATSGHAATIDVSIFNAIGYNGSFDGSANSSEDFEQLGMVNGEGEVGASINTKVGTLRSIGGVGTGGTVNQPAGNTGTQLALRNGSVFGRTNNTPIGGDWFLDTNDTFGLIWDVSLGGKLFDKLKFVLQDGSDAGAYLRISAGGAVRELRTGAKLPDGNARVIEIDFGGAVSSAQVVLGNFTSNGSNTYKKNDGFSVDGLDISTVPLPASVLLLGAAVGGLGAMRRLKAEKS